MQYVVGIRIRVGQNVIARLVIARETHLALDSTSVISRVALESTSGQRKGAMSESCMDLLDYARNPFMGLSVRYVCTQPVLLL